MTTQAKTRYADGNNQYTKDIAMADKKNSYDRLKSKARVTTYFTPDERDWVDANLVPDGMKRTEWLRKLIHEEAKRKGLEPPFEIDRLS